MSVQVDNSSLYEAVRQGREAEEALIEQNLPLTYLNVRSFLANHPEYTYLQEDLISVAQLGLIESVRKMSGNVTNVLGYLNTSIQRAVRRAAIKETGWMDVLSPDANLEYILWDEPSANELYAELIACCRDDLDVRIIDLRVQGETFAAISTLLGVKNHTVVSRINTIRETYKWRMK